MSHLSSIEEKHHNKNVQEVIAMKIPTELKYTATHEWIKVQGNVGTIGITDYAQEKLGDVVYVELPTKGFAGTKGNSFGSIESVKAVSDLFMPVTGQVTEINPDLKDNPQFVNEDPYGKGWMIKIKVKNPQEAGSLLDAKAYQNVAKD
jgi:glycine cleavage system H protein